MDVLGSQKADSMVSTSGAPDPPVWNMTPKKEWTAIAACCMCLFLVRHIFIAVPTYNLMSPAFTLAIALGWLERCHDGAALANYSGALWC
jgi:hypothetical protein